MNEMNITAFTTPNGDKMVIIPERDYEYLMGIEDVADITAVKEIKESIARGEEGYIPFEMAIELGSGTKHPIRIWREHRGFTAKALAEKSNVSAVHLSNIETHKKDAGIEVYQKLAHTLNVDIDDLVVRRQE